MKKNIIILLAVINSGCMNSPIEDSSPHTSQIDIFEVKDATPKYEKRTRAGNPKEYQIFGKTYRVLKQSAGYKKQGMASWYGKKFHGRKTSNGEVYDMYAMTAAHKTLPIPSYVRVTNLNNGKVAVLRINDRGPFHDNRIIDLSYTAAVKLGIQQAGTGLVEVEALGFDSAEEVENKIYQLSEDDYLGVFYLQMGAFSDASNASFLQGKLSRLDHTATRIQQENTGSSTIYKVQIGPFHSEQQAREQSEKLQQIGFSKAILVVENNEKDLKQLTPLK